jgi:hypothetical protein
MNPSSYRSGMTIFLCTVVHFLIPKAELTHKVSSHNSHKRGEKSLFPRCVKQKSMMYGIVMARERVLTQLREKGENPFANLCQHRGALLRKQ